MCKLSGIGLDYAYSLIVLLFQVYTLHCIRMFACFLLHGLVLTVDAVFVESKQIYVMSHSCIGLCGLDLASTEYGLLVWWSCLRNEDVSVILCITSGRLLVPVENHNCICAAFCICGFVCKWLYTCLVQSIRVLSVIT